MLYRTLARKALLESDASDNLTSALELRRLHGWNHSDVELAMSEVAAVLRFEFKLEDETKRLAATELVGWLLQQDPTKRPSNFDEVMNHAFFRDVVKSQTKETGGDASGGSSKPKKRSSIFFGTKAIQEWQMSTLHRAAALGNIEVFRDLQSDGGGGDAAEEEKLTDTDINSTQHILGKTPLHLACEHGQTGALEEILKTPGLDVKIKDHLGNTAVHSMLAAAERAANRRDRELVEKLKPALELLLKEKRSAFNAEDAQGRSGFDLGRSSPVQAIQKLFKGVNVILGALRERDDFNVEDFDIQWQVGGDETRVKLKEAVFDLLDGWAFNEGESIEEKRPYLQRNIFPLVMWTEGSAQAPEAAGAEEPVLLKELKDRANKRMKIILSEVRWRVYLQII